MPQIRTGMGMMMPKKAKVNGAITITTLMVMKMLKDKRKTKNVLNVNDKKEKNSGNDKKEKNSGNDKKEKNGGNAKKSKGIVIIMIG